MRRISTCSTRLVDGTAQRRDLGIEGKFSLAYIGTMGVANGLDFVLDAAAELKRRRVDDIVLMLHGDGMERAALEERARREGLDNVLFSGPTPKHQVAELVAAVDVCMTIFKNVPVLQTCSPNKLFDALAAGKPILTNMPGWLADIAEKDKTGVFVEPDNAVDFADKAIWLRDHPDEVAEFHLNARCLAEKKFARDVLARQLESVLERAVEPIQDRLAPEVSSAG